MARDPQHEQTQMTSAGAAMFLVAIGSVVALIALASATRFLGPPAIAVWAIAAWTGVTIFRGPVGQAIARNIGGHVPEAPAELPAELYAELDELRARVNELEERVDFSERLLTKQPSGSGPNVAKEIQ